MHIISVIILVGLLGALGGLTNCFVAGELSPARRDPNTGVWRPGWIGNVLVGGVAAVLVWGIYGPSASVDIIRGNLRDVSLSIAQLFSSLGVGFSGGRILTDIAGKQADRVVKDNLVRAMQNIVEK